MIRASSIAKACACAAAVVLAVPVWAAPAVATARAKAISLTPLTILKTRDLDFGNIVAGPLAGTVTINPYSDVATYTGVVGAGGTVQAARFLGAGTAGQIVLVRWPTTAVTLTRQGGGATMLLDTLRVNSPLIALGGIDPRVIPPDRVIDVRVGGRLRVGANQGEGDYLGNFQVTIDYQ